MPEPSLPPADTTSAQAPAHGDGNAAVVAALASNAFIALTKFAAWALTGSVSMLAEAIHSSADTGNQILLLLGSKKASKRATAEHPFGYGRERYVTAFMVSIILFSLGGLFALYEAWHKVIETRDGHPNELLESRWWWVPLAVLCLSIVAESFSFRTAIRESKKSKGSQSWLRFIKTAKAPELPIILLEDFAALLGLAFALVGVGMTLITGSGYWDAAGTALIGLLLVSVAVTLAIETNSLLLGESASPQAIERIALALRSTPGVDRIIHMKTLHLGPEEVLVAAKIAVPGAETAAKVADVIDAAERAIRAAVPMVGPIYIEPDVYEADYTPDPRPDRPAPPSH